ncbi:hypothetical protein FQN52_006688 [Onygenales sp. PD_12]|nr:hypothetical protein FQN52_006688 [Onygenales sp. PD_12]
MAQYVRRDSQLAGKAKRGNVATTGRHIPTDNATDDGFQHSSGVEASRPSRRDSVSWRHGLLRTSDQMPSALKGTSDLHSYDHTLSDLSDDSSSDGDSVNVGSTLAMDLAVARAEMRGVVEEFSAHKDRNYTLKDDAIKLILLQQKERDDRLLAAKSRDYRPRSSENTEIQPSTVPTTSPTTMAEDAVQASPKFNLSNDDVDNDGDRYLSPRPRLSKNMETKVATVARTSSSTRMMDDPRIVFKHYTISEDLSREEKDKRAKLQYLSKKLDRGRLELRNMRL